MQTLLSIKVRVQKSVQQLVLKMRRNERNLKRYIIEVSIFFNAQKNAGGMQIQIDSQAGYPHKVVMAHLRRA